ncbi:MAG: ribonuclease III [Clostridia bacterium]|nr:ribonuclease III [Clostridia bacterium]
MSRHLSQLEQRIGYRFQNPTLLKNALIHSSYANESGSKHPALDCNERMEFLGDTVLSLVVSTYLFQNHPDLPEGNLSKLRSFTVCEKALAEFAAEIRLGDYLLLGKGEDNNNGRQRPSITSDAFEALIAAIYLDSGLENAQTFVLRFAVPHIEHLLSEQITEDYKTALQQIVQQEQGEKLEYILIAEEGPPHQRTFTMEARLNSNVIGRGVGSSKREAEQRAAKEALTLFGKQ